VRIGPYVGALDRSVATDDGRSRSAEASLGRGRVGTKRGSGAGAGAGTSGATPAPESPSSLGIAAHLPVHRVTGTQVALRL